MKTILMKITSRERPTELLHCVKQFVKLANNTKHMVWLFSFDKDDESYTKAFVGQLYHIIPSKNVIIKRGVSTDKINAINRDVDKIKNWDILLNISDDQIPIEQGYDDIIRHIMPDTLDYSLWFSDSHQNRINTQEILGYNYYKLDNFIYDPRFKSFFCDNYSTLVAQSRFKMIQSGRCIIKHFHPDWEKDTHMKRDALYAKNATHWNHDQALFNQLFNEIMEKERKPNQQIDKRWS